MKFKLIMLMITGMLFACTLAKAGDHSPPVKTEQTVTNVTSENDVLLPAITSVTYQSQSVQLSAPEMLVAVCATAALKPVESEVLLFRQGDSKRYNKLPNIKSPNYSNAPLCFIKNNYPVMENLRLVLC